MARGTIIKNIVLQHWTGEMNELGTFSSANISKYAEMVDADYRLLRGDVFRSDLSPPMQKLHMLDEVFDEYDVVVMLDIDMFIRKGMDENIFGDNIQGVGLGGSLQNRLLKSMSLQKPAMANLNYPYWGGAVYKLDRQLRQKLRVHINENELPLFSGQGRYEDEGMMHRLATLAKIEKCCLPGGKKWSHGSFEDGIENAAIIHIRTKIAPQGPKRAKIVNYRELVDRGLIEEYK